MTDATGFTDRCANEACEETTAADRFPETECFMVLAGKGATADGSVLLAHNNDLNGHEAALIEKFSRKKHGPDEVVSFPSGLNIPQVEKTYAWLVLEIYTNFAKGDAAAINEYQVSVAGGVALGKDRNDRAAAADPLMEKGLTGRARYIALERSKTARQCVERIGRLYTEYGITYPSGVGVADPNEVWYLEAGGGHTWAAVRVPDNCYWVQANGYRIAEIDPDDPDNFLCSPGLLSFCEKHGLWNPKEGPFYFSKAFGGKKLQDPCTMYYDARRVWDAMRALSPSLNLDPEATVFPMYAVPDEKITIQKLMSEDVLRAHFKGTPYDPYPLEGPGTDERPAAVESCVHTDVIQLRSWLPTDIGAVLWAGLGNSLSTVYVPYYFGIKDVPLAFRTAGPEYDPASAYWAFKALSNLVAPRSAALTREVLAVWQDFESDALAQQASVEKTALDLYETERPLAQKYLTAYTNALSLQALDTARRLARRLHTKIAETGSKWRLRAPENPG